MDRVNVEVIRCPRKRKVIELWIKSSIAVSALIVAVFSPVLFAAPMSPSDLRVEIYSSTALELFWSRANSSDRVTGYELDKNGSRVWIGDVNSFMDTELKQGAINNYAIVAVDENGVRSLSSRVVSISIENAGSENISSSAGEIFWESHAGSVDRYDVYRNGNWVTSTNGKSYFDSGLAHATVYEYKVYSVRNGVSKLIGSATINTGSL